MQKRMNRLKILNLAFEKILKIINPVIITKEMSVRRFPVFTILNPLRGRF